MTSPAAEPKAKTSIVMWTNGGWQRCLIHFNDADDVIAWYTRKREGFMDENPGALYFDAGLEELVYDPRANWPEDVVLTTFPEVGPLTPSQLRLMEHLYPTCEHGMSADLCMGPDHFMSRDQETARFGY